MFIDKSILDKTLHKLIVDPGGGLGGGAPKQTKNLE